MTLPIVLLIFGQFSLVSLLANVLVLPFVPLSMLLTFVSGVAFFVHAELAGIISWVSYIVLQYITSVITALSRFDWALIDVGLAWPQTITMYLLIALVVSALSRRWRAAESRTASSAIL